MAGPAFAGPLWKESVLDGKTEEPRLALPTVR